MVFCGWVVLVVWYKLIDLYSWLLCGNEYLFRQKFSVCGRFLGLDADEAVRRGSKTRIVIFISNMAVIFEMLGVYICLVAFMLAYILIG